MIEPARARKRPAQLSREFEYTAQTISNWVAQQAIDRGKPLPGKDGLGSAEREELNRCGERIGSSRRSARDSSRVRRKLRHASDPGTTDRTAAFSRPQARCEAEATFVHPRHHPPTRIRRDDAARPASAAGTGSGQPQVLRPRAGPTLGGRHDLRADVDRLRLVGGGARRLEPSRRGLVDRPVDDGRSRSCRPERGTDPAPRTEDGLTTVGSGVACATPPVDNPSVTTLEKHALTSLLKRGNSNHRLADRPADHVSTPAVEDHRQIDQGAFTSAQGSYQPIRRGCGPLATI